MRVREIKKEDIKVGVKVIHKVDYNKGDFNTNTIRRTYMDRVFYESNEWDFIDSVKESYLLVEEEPKSNDTKVMTYIGGSAKNATDGKNYNVSDSKEYEGMYRYIGDDGCVWYSIKDHFVDPSEYRNKLENHINKGTKHDQIGGSHYNKNDPIQFARDNYPKEQLEGFFRINVDKYVARYDKKNGLEDLKKAKHYLDMLIELKEIEYAKQVE